MKSKKLSAKPVSKSKSSFPWNEVTPLSKTLAMVLFVVLPFLAFVLGMVYQQALFGV